ncbi:hypothetical protein CS542_07945 [Pedobacter sp. IW39]|nr:hypothetical protein CS542_07945 [Pedobacter sp. IW39]
MSKMIQNDEEAEDIAAISFIKLWDRKDDFDTKMLKHFYLLPVETQA